MTYLNPMRLYLARHAETASNLQGINFNDKDDKPLTSNGVFQSHQLAKRLAGLEIDQIFISESKRSYQTALPFLKLSRLSFQKDQRLNEADFGIFSGLTLQEAESKYPEVWQKRLEDKYNFRIPEGESYKDVARRLDSFFQELEQTAKKQKLKNILIITHATPLKVFLIHFLGYSIKQADAIYFGNASLSIFDFNKNGVKAIKIAEHN